MALHAPPVRPAAAPEHVDRWLAGMLVILAIVVAGVVWLASGYSIEIVPPQTAADAAAQYMIDHRQSERASVYPAAEEYAIQLRASERESR
jgi:hypothetical protein